MVLTTQYGNTTTSYMFSDIADIIGCIIKENVLTESWQWLNQKKLEADNPILFNTAYSIAPRKTGKKIIELKDEYKVSINRIVPGFSINGWTVDRLSRVWLLLQINTSAREEYIRRIESLFQAAEMNELVALYSSLPLLAYPDTWRNRCAEGIRSNIADVLQSIMCNNPYPAGYMEEPAWNQMVLKAFFTEKPVHQIIGLDARANKELAKILSDYAHERWAAHRSVNPLLWRCVAPFLNAELFKDIERIAASDNPLEREAAVLVCRQSNYPPAKELLNNEDKLQELTNNEELSWESLARKAAL